MTKAQKGGHPCKMLHCGIYAANQCRVICAFWVIKWKNILV